MWALKMQTSSTAPGVSKLRLIGTDRRVRVAVIGPAMFRTCSSAVAREVRAGQLVCVPLADRPLPPSVLSLCVNSERQLSLPAGTLLRLVKQRLGAL